VTHTIAAYRIPAPFLDTRQRPPPSGFVQTAFESVAPCHPGLEDDLLGPDFWPFDCVYGRYQAASPEDTARWTVRDGVPNDIVAIQQTQDGYLWLGTGEGPFPFRWREVRTLQAESGNRTILQGDQCRRRRVRTGFSVSTGASC
jgi:hypothetical protein